MVRTLVVTSCTGEKKHKPENQLTKEDFISPDRLREREKQLWHLRLPAVEMYTGMQHLRLIEGVSLLRRQFNYEIIDLSILSAGYGLISENHPIVPYEVTFNTMNNREIKEWAGFLNIHNNLGKLVKDYDLVFFLLGDKYLRALELPFEDMDESKKLIFLASNTSKKLIPPEKPYYFVQVGQEEASSFSYGLVGLKGYLFKLFAQEMSNEGIYLLDRVYNNPELFLGLLHKYRKDDNSKKGEINLFPNLEPVNDANENSGDKTKRKIDFFIPSGQYAKNYGQPVLYFIPEWDDRVDPGYDFLTDTPGPNRSNPYLHDVYAHEIYDVPNYDGLLASKIKVEENKTKKSNIEKFGVHKFFRFPKDRPVMGDCGAFGYIDEYEPPYTTEEILNYYERTGFNLGVSIDHLIVGKYANDPDERIRRYRITQNNAIEFIKKYKEGNFTFIPSGVAQGWDPESYRNAVGSLIELGYEHISLGGLARTPTSQLVEILKSIAPIVPDYLQLHLFGVARLDAIGFFRKLGMTSFDSATHLRRAWLGSGNYYTSEGEKYAAIRVPPVEGHGVRVRKMIAEGRGTQDQFKILEERSLDALRKYDHGKIRLEDTLQAVLAYDELIGEGRDRHAELYRRVLEDQPWKKCDCKICREIGIEVIIFRGNNRNRRRGFHNTYVFYKQFKEICKS